MAAAAILNLLPSRFLAYRRFWIMVLCVPVKFYLNRGRVIKFCKKIKMAAVRHLELLCGNTEPLTKSHC